MAGSTDRSYRRPASLTRRSRRTVRDTAAGSHTAASNSTSVLSPSISVLPAPITPPIAAVATSSTISTSPGSSLRSMSSRVTTVSPGRANRTAKSP